MTDGTGLDLRGKVAVVTGAAAGIGRAIALSLAACGADLALCDRDADGLAGTVAAVSGSDPAPVSGVLDVRHANAVADFAGQVRDRFSRADILVNNAGGGFYAHFLDVSAGGEAALVAENFTSVTLMTRAFVPLMTAGGSIINLTTVEVFRAAPGFGVYAAMKAAVEHLSRTLALELAPRRIRVNCVAPDAIPTPGDESLSGAANPGGHDAYDRKVPLGWGTADDCAGPVLFLASDLSRFVTGTTVRADGGSSAAGGWTRRDDGTYAP